MEALNYKKYGDGEAIIILHGLFGMLDNWKTFGRMLSQDYAVYLVDQRNHGSSPHADSHTYADMATDLKEWMNAVGIVEAHIMGHSMGGKTAMTFALEFPEKAMSMISVDMGVISYKGHHDQYFKAMRSLPIEKISTRSEAEEHLRKLIPDKAIRLFIMKNIHRMRDGSYEWKFNLAQLYEDYEEILRGLETDKQYLKEALFIRGIQSGYIKDGDLSGIKGYFPQAELISMNTGHWVHAEKPKELLQVVKTFLQSV